MIFYDSVCIREQLAPLNIIIIASILRIMLKSGKLIHVHHLLWLSIAVSLNMPPRSIYWHKIPGQRL